MMDLFNNLWNLGGGAATAAPTDMSQIKVPQQAMDLAGTVDAVNSQLDFNSTQPGTDWGQVGKIGLLALGQSVGGGQKKEQPLVQAPQYRGGRRPQATTGEALSGANMASLQKFAQAQGLLSR